MVPGVLGDACGSPEKARGAQIVVKLVRSNDFVALAVPLRGKTVTDFVVGKQVCRTGR